MSTHLQRAKDEIDDYDPPTREETLPPTDEEVANAKRWLAENMPKPERR